MGCTGKKILADIKETALSSVPQEIIENKILLIRGKKVILDVDLAELYAVETKALNRAVKRNIERFPEDFMFQLTAEEFKPLRCQIVTSKTGRGGRRYAPSVFTEHGILMLSSVLNSKRAILVNIQIMRVFTKLRELISTHRDLKQKIEEMEKKYDNQVKVVFDALRQILDPPVKPKKRIGFQAGK